MRLKARQAQSGQESGRHFHEDQENFSPKAGCIMRDPKTSFSHDGIDSLLKYRLLFATAAGFIPYVKEIAKVWKTSNKSS
jgi:hypothetical protein